MVETEYERLVKEMAELKKDMKNLNQVIRGLVNYILEEYELESDELEDLIYPGEMGYNESLGAGETISSSAAS